MGLERAYSCILFLNWYKSGGERKKWRGGENLTLLTKSIQDTSPRIHPSRNKKRVSDK
jgi:hypothetical protein